MSNTTIKFCGNIMLKYVKMHFSGNQNWGFMIGITKCMRLHF